MAGLVLRIFRRLQMYYSGLKQVATKRLQVLLPISNESFKQ